MPIKYKDPNNGASIFVPTEEEKKILEESRVLKNIPKDVEELSKLSVNILKPPAGITPAKSDGQTNIAPTLQACIDYVNANGFGSVVIPYNEKGYTMTSKVELKSHVTLISYGSTINVPSVSKTIFYTFNVTNCVDVHFVGKFKFRSTNDKERPVFSGLSSNVRAITIQGSSDVYIDTIEGENIETLVNIYGNNLLSEKNININEISYSDCNFGLFVKQYSTVNARYIHGRIEKLQIDPHDHVVYLNNNVDNVFIDTIHGYSEAPGNPVWMVQLDTNTYEDTKLSKNVTINNIIADGNWSGFVNGGFSNVYVGNLSGNIKPRARGTFIGAYYRSNTTINNVQLEGETGTFLSCLGSSSEKNNIQINSGYVNAKVGGSSSDRGYLIRAEYTNKMVINNVLFNNISHPTTSTYFVPDSENQTIIFNGCKFVYTEQPAGYLILLASGKLDVTNCEFVNLNTNFSQIFKTEIGTSLTVRNSQAKNFIRFAYYNPPEGADSFVFDCILLQDNSIINEFNGGFTKRFHGKGDPNGVVNAPVGSQFFRVDGSTSTTYYVKESGTGNTGWKAK